MRGRVVVEARTAVLDRDDDGGRVAAQRDPDAAYVGRDQRVEGVVDEVAEHGDEVAGGHVAVGESALDAELDAALGGVGVLAEQQRLDHRVADRADDLVGEQLRDLQLLGREVDGLVDPAELDEGDHRVQPVGGLVVLGAERVAEAADHVQLAGDRAQLGVVAQGDHGTDVRALPGGGGRAHDQDPVAREVDVVGLGGPSERCLHQPGREAELGERAAEHVVGQVQQPARLVVDELDPASVSSSNSPSRTAPSTAV